MTILEVQRRHRLLGRIRIGAKEDGRPVSSTTFRLTSPNEELLRHASGVWGGIPTVWADAPGQGVQYELVTESEEIDVMVPDQDVAANQWYELWSRGGCQRRCDGVTDTVGDQPCVCDPDKRACKPTTHLEVVLPTIPDVGIWRLTTHGWNAASEIPSTVELIRQLSTKGIMPIATLAIEQRSSTAEGKTKHFSVPVLRLPFALASLGNGSEQVSSGAIGSPGMRERPALPEETAGEVGEGARPASPATTVVDGEQSVWTAPADDPEPAGEVAARQGTVAYGEGVIETEGQTTTPPDREEAWRRLVVIAGNRSRARAWLNEATGKVYNAATVNDATLAEILKTLKRAPSA